MYKKSDILIKLNSENYYIDNRTLSTFIGLWNIEAVYEDENKEDYYDDYAIEKLKKGINLKAQGFPDDSISRKIKKIVEDVDYIENNKQELITNIDNNELSEVSTTKPLMKNLTLDVSTQTLQMIAESVAQKITEDIKNSGMAEKLIEAGGYKKDNEILSGQIDELINHNRKLAERIDQLENKQSFWIKLKNLFS